jgi:hypothetical protein
VLIERARSGGDAPRGMLLEEIDAAPAGDSPLAPFLLEAGFIRTAMGLQAVLSRQSSVTSHAVSGQAVRSRQTIVSSPFARRNFDSTPDPTDTDD